MKLIITIAVLSISAVCFADEGAEQHRSPFEKLEHVYHHGYAARLSDFTYNDGSTPGANPNDLKCIVQVGPNTQRNEVTLNDRIPYLLDGRIVAGQALPDNGPLFPGHPERDEVRQSILWAGPGFRQGQVEIGQYMAANHIVLNVSEDELSETFGGNQKFSFRIHGGLLIEQDSTVNEKGEVTSVNGYEYCWSASGRVRRDAREVEETQDAPAPLPVVETHVPTPQPQPRRGD